MRVIVQPRSYGSDPLNGTGTGSRRATSPSTVTSSGRKPRQILGFRCHKPGPAHRVQNPSRFVTVPRMPAPSRRTPAARKRRRRQTVPHRARRLIVLTVVSGALLGTLLITAFGQGAHPPASSGTAWSLQPAAARRPADAAARLRFTAAFASSSRSRRAA
jgi:hypothetical protein